MLYLQMMKTCGILMKTCWLLYSFFVSLFVMHSFLYVSPILIFFVHSSIFMHVSDEDLEYLLGLNLSTNRIKSYSITTSFVQILDVFVGGILNEFAQHVV